MLSLFNGKSSIGFQRSNLTPVNWLLVKQMNDIEMCNAVEINTEGGNFKNGGETGIRTLETLLEPIPFSGTPSVPFPTP